MSLSAVITAVVVLTLVWGGFALFLSKAVIKERNKKRNGKTKS